MKMRSSPPDQPLLCSPLPDQHSQIINRKSSISLACSQSEEIKRISSGGCTKLAKLLSNLRTLSVRSQHCPKNTLRSLGGIPRHRRSSIRLVPKVRIP